MLYRHYKGDLYRVLHESIHTETGEQLTIYMSVKDGRVWARPTEMFHELVTLENGRSIPRFIKVGKQ